MKTSTQLNLAKHADGLIGRPLCAVLSLVCRLIPSRPAALNAPRKVLLIKLTEMGAIVLAYPLMAHLKERFAGCTLHFLTFRRNAGVFELLNGMVEPRDVIVVPEQFSWRSLWALIRRLRRERYDVVIDLEFFARITACLSFLTGAPVRVGFHKYSFEGLDRGNLLTHRIQHNPLLHVSKLYLSMVQLLAHPSKSSPELDHPIDEMQLTFPLWKAPSALKKAMTARLRAGGVTDQDRVVLVNAGEGAIPLREWPLENFLYVASEILNDPKCFVILIGEKSEAGKDERLQQMIHSNRCLNWSGQTSLPELMTLFELADMLLINDCGLGHLASLTSVETFILFGPETPQVFAPVKKAQHIFYSCFPCSPCLSVLNHRRSLCRDNRCLKAIQPRQVLETVRLHLNAKPQGTPSLAPLSQ